MEAHANMVLFHQHLIILSGLGAEGLTQNYP